MKPRGRDAVVVGVLLMGIAYALDFLAQPPRYAFSLAVLGWCVTAFGLGMLYREFVRAARERRGPKGPPGS
jgi:hypothetical protein